MNDSTQPTSRAPLIPRWVAWFAASAITLGALGGFIHFPYYSLGPGPSTNVLTALEVHGARAYPSKGKLLLTTASVSGRTLNVWDMVYVWLDPAVTTIPAHALLGGNTTQEQDAENFYDMEVSKAAAELAAFDVVGRHAKLIPGARVMWVIPDSPADGKIFMHDRITAVDGKPIRTWTEVAPAVRRHRVGQKVAVTVEHAGITRTLRLVTAPLFSDRMTASIGVMAWTAYRFPVQIDIDTESVGGPSGGLVFALAIADVLTPEDLTRGHVVAATGLIEIDDKGVARVGEIGAIQEKVRSVVAAGADVFLVPASEAPEARSVAPRSLRVVGVRTLREAIDVLRSLRPVTHRAAD